MSKKFDLRPYQLEQLAAIRGGLAQGLNRLLIKSPTGTGKTVMFSSMLNNLGEWLEQFPKTDRKMLVIAHREELLDQAAAKIAANNPGLMVMVEQGERRASTYADVIVASIQTLSAMKFRRLERFISRFNFRIVVVDEAHHSAADTYRGALIKLGFLPPAEAGTDDNNFEAPKYEDVALMEKALVGWDKVAPRDRVLVGVTATPNRSDAIGLGCVFQSLVYSYGLKEAIRDGWLVPLEPWTVETDTSLDDVRLNRGDFNQRELADAVNNARRNQLALAAYREYADGVPTIAFTVDVAHAHDAAKVFQDGGYRALAISGETPKEDRRMALEQFQNGQVDQLFNCMVLTEGTDLPRAACILHLKPTKSATLYEQMTGRGLRLFPGKEKCIVIDLVDVARRHSLQAAPVLYGLPPGLAVKGKKLEQVEEELEAFAAKGMDLEKILEGKHLTLEQLSAIASTFDIWTVPELGAFGNGRALNWMKSGENVYRLEYPWADGKEVVTVSSDLVGKWSVSLTMRPADHSPARQRTIAAGVLDADAAAGLAESFILQERRSVTKLKDKDAPWRSRPASPKQLGLLKRLRVPNIPANCTMGQASDLIDLANARRG